MRAGLRQALVLFGLVVVGAPEAAAQPSDRVVVSGTVVDSLSAGPVRLAAVRVVESGRSQLTTDEGRFRLELAPGRWTLDVRRVGYLPVAVPLVLAADSVQLVVHLVRRPLELEELTVTAEDDPAERIIRRAIAAKRDALDGLRDYEHQAFVRLLIRDLTKSADSAESILAITESRVDASWKHPGRYQERIIARRQSGNIPADNNVVTIGELLNFSRDRIELGPHQLPSPIADDALRHYRFRILDTLRLDRGLTYRLALEPRSEAAPAFVGVIDVLDSTYRVLTIDVGLNPAAQLSPLVNVRYRQLLTEGQGGLWWPQQIRFSAELAFKVPLPGVPRRLGLEHIATLGPFDVDRGVARDFHYRIMVAPDADRADSARWREVAGPPLTPVEARAWVRIDSIADRRRGPIRQLLRLVLDGVVDARGADFFHFNRVDGAYLGASVLEPLGNDLRLAAKLGYGTSSDRAQYRVGTDFGILPSRDLWLGWRLHDETMTRPTLPSQGRDATLKALVARDPFDYYRERGLVLSADARLIGPVRVGADYRDARQTSLPLSSDYTLRRGERVVRVNPAIEEGRLRSITGRLSFDTRPVMRGKGGDVLLPMYAWSRIQVSAEVSDPDWIASDFAYRRYQVDAVHRRRVGTIGTLTLRGVAGWSNGALPPQRQFGVDHGTDLFGLERIGFNNLGDTLFAGNRIWAVTAIHEFGRLPLAASGIPVVRDLPVRVSVHGGAFQTHWRHRSGARPPGAQDATDRVFGEVGLRFDGLTPFLAPFDLTVAITRQLSAFPTKTWSVGFGFFR